MANKRRELSNRRRSRRGRRNYKFFIISTEGKTEKEYFEMLAEIIRQHDNKKAIKVLTPDDKSAPKHVLKRLEVSLHRQNMRPSDEAWLVVDVDDWGEDKLGSLYNWQKNNTNYGLAVSNPSFEFWLLLHFEEGTDITSSKDCINRLESKEYLPNYSKTKIDSRKITINHINKAINRAKKMDNPPCKTWPQRNGTTVYKLVEKLL